MICTETTRVVIDANPAALRHAVGELAKEGLTVVPVLGTIDRLGYFDVDPRSTPEKRAAAAESLRLDEGMVELLQGFADGLTNDEIADRHGLPSGTVKTRCGRLYGLLGVASREEAVLVALRRGVLDGGPL